MTNQTTDVAIIMGSDSDLPIVEAAFPILESFGVNYTKNVLSAHRTPHAVIDFINKSESNGCKVFIAAAGMAAHLAGALAAHTTKPVIGIPIESGGMGGMDSLLSTVMMPPGVPVATVAVGKSGAKNSAILAVQILATGNDALSSKLDDYKENMKNEVLEKNNKLNS
ncbi:5-(carboxyamino)imidazole ribonucleotide mutase [Gammaproteobacteria bacterium]|nr:5-(carboxyamino)imidazole ribonucleotide mutase [Gammaproteobacteria bacterium]MDA7802196.1 5-(carboxyamino)imidazole ribonucleotide mutase [Gammaproteobacteria bacterium]MDA7856837.1 5-(carboxyamino)imidazole ribonucleotide mutase [Gammaproteobacteria bacterium]MDA8856426.1 5-(carboxyamino)imidazole ribonucleotide mutase [Gammaproteobacteria bacterium]MDA8957716.1 5-(carboxyamino)imidazole ribonucleotide mutase [Gammaproteobacteria bacterium]|tara:strand:+ start:3784 stop:4284 length:501 start_codon:yes stop_codon:yes gene_type:complete